MRTSILLLILIFLHLLPASGYAAEVRSLGVLVGSGTYHGARAGVEPLRHTDLDVLRMTRALRPYTQPEDLWILTEPGEAVAEELTALGVTRWEKPTVSAVEAALIAFRNRAAEARANGQEVEGVIAISSHGDDLGLHLADAPLPGARLRQLLFGLDVQRLLLVVDACHSAVLLDLKAKGEMPTGGVAVEALRLPEVEAALALGAEVGSVTALAATVEDRSFIRGGLITYLMSEALMGGADVDGDGTLLYREVDAHLDKAAQRWAGLANVQVRAPEGTRGDAQELRRLSGDGGIELPPERSACYLLVAGERIPQVIGEPCPRQHPTLLHLPDGAYRVVRIPKPGATEGMETVAHVTGTKRSLAVADFTEPWYHPSYKGPGDGRGRPLSESEVAALSLQGSGTWDPAWWYVAGRWQPFAGLQGSWPTALAPQSLPNEDFQSVGSLTGEAPSYAFTAGTDLRAVMLGTGFGAVGVRVALGVGPQTQVASGLAPILRMDVRTRWLLERPMTVGAARIILELGGTSARPWLGTSQELDAAAAAAAAIPLTPSGALGVGLSRRIRPGIYLDSTVYAEGLIEWSDLGTGVGEPVPFVSVMSSVGVRWFP